MKALLIGGLFYFIILTTCFHSEHGLIGGTFLCRIFVDWPAADYYESLVQVCWKEMYEVISAQYGESFGAFPSINVLNKDFNLTNVWHYGKKTIKLGIMQSENYKYSVGLLLIYQPIDDSLSEIREKQQNEAIEKSIPDF
jgi:hypothetical protein